ncbi:MAG: hypothetical protein M3299_06825 [Thermoproteota archaeon]|nr:hypothetical protein [Thermoproteota archaeon]
MAQQQQEMTDTDSTTTGGDDSVKATTTEGGGNQTISEAIMHLQEVRTALQNNDSRGAMMHLDIALDLLGNTTQGSSSDMTITLDSNATARFGGSKPAGSTGDGEL